MKKLASILVAGLTALMFASCSAGDIARRYANRGRTRNGRQHKGIHV